ncbi:MAG TPA: T9SS type A sorting domain-containing protein [Ferruginibacter sp.]|nr:T9SS type A sorting domain-containing protein [Ferruginibacter sp.]HRE63414.1 T9SS type A sorting domain-containing protein [Ferruginibacter sp.]
MKKYLLFLLYSLVAISIKAQPPNNAIFFGGGGDGATGLSYSVSANTIFIGGIGDGAAIATNNVTANNLFFGGSGDGFAQQSNNAVSNSIFLGSVGDGFSNAVNTSTPNNIFRGGAGDGWHAVIFPMGPLPVKLLSFTAEQDGKTHLVKWVTAEEINTKHFEVQRSANGSSFETIGISNPAGSASAGAFYRFTVSQPWQGNNFYRLKIVDTDGSITYSNIVLLKNEGDLQLAVYPNPTSEQLFVKIPIMVSPASINATIINANGQVVLQTQLKPGIANAIDVSRLAAGMYTLQCNINHQPFTLRFIKSK